MTFAEQEEHETARWMEAVARAGSIDDLDDIRRMETRRYILRMEAERDAALSMVTAARAWLEGIVGGDAPTGFDFERLEATLYKADEMPSAPWIQRRIAGRPQPMFHTRACGIDSHPPGPKCHASCDCQMASTE